MTDLLLPQSGLRELTIEEILRRKREADLRGYPIEQKIDANTNEGLSFPKGLGTEYGLIISSKNGAELRATTCVDKTELLGDGLAIRSMAITENTPNPLYYSDPSGVYFWPTTLVHAEQGIEGIAMRENRLNFATPAKNEIRDYSQGIKYDCFMPSKVAYVGNHQYYLRSGSSALSTDYNSVVVNGVFSAIAVHDDALFLGDLDGTITYIPHAAASFGWRSPSSTIMGTMPSSIRSIDAITVDGDLFVWCARHDYVNVYDVRNNVSTPMPFSKDVKDVNAIIAAPMREYERIVNARRIING